jgi:UMF1 family MFS transporter
MMPATDSGGLFGTPAEKAYTFYGLIGLAFDPYRHRRALYGAQRHRSRVGPLFRIYALAGWATSFAAPSWWQR